MILSSYVIEHRIGAQASLRIFRHRFGGIAVRGGRSGVIPGSCLRILCRSRCCFGRATSVVARGRSGGFAARGCGLSPAATCCAPADRAVMVACAGAGRGQLSLLDRWIFSGTPSFGAGLLTYCGPTGELAIVPMNRLEELRRRHAAAEARRGTRAPRAPTPGRQTLRARAHRTAARRGLVRRTRQAGHASLPRFRHGRSGHPRRWLHHRLWPHRRPSRLCLRAGFHGLRRVALRSQRAEDLQDHGPRAEDRARL